VVIFGILKSFLWRPFRIESKHSALKLEEDLKSKIIIEPSFHLMPYYGKLSGNVKDGKFVIRFIPLSSLWTRGSGSTKIKGGIESAGVGAQIFGQLPGPSIITYALFLVSLAAFVISIFRQIMNLNTGPGDFKGGLIAGVIFMVIGFAMFIGERVSNNDGIEKIMSVLREISA
jgi:hypothetical protein